MNIIQQFFGIAILASAVMGLTTNWLEITKLFIAIPTAFFGMLLINKYLLK